MSYILIEKQNENEKSVKQLVTEYLQRSGFEYRNSSFHLGEEKIDIEIKNKQNSNRCYVKLHSSMRVNKGVGCLQKFDDCLFKSDFQKYADVIRDYDGISAAISEKLYSKYALFERCLRQLILLVVTKAFGNAWIQETISEDTRNELKERARGNLTLTGALEQLDLYQMEEYLFGLREVNYSEYFDKKLSKDQMDELSKDALIAIVDEMRPRSLWERNFATIGPEDKWKANIKAVHDCRNKVAHHKHITVEEYSDVNKKLNRLNNDLKRALEEIQDKDFTNQSAIDVLGNFAILTSKLIGKVLEQYDFTQMFQGINNAIQKLAAPVKDSYQFTIADSLTQVSRSMTKMMEPIRANEELINVAKRFANLQMQPTVLPQITSISYADVEALETASRMNEIAKGLQASEDRITTDVNPEIEDDSKS